MYKTFSGQINVTTSGTAVQGPNIPNPGGFFLKANPNNTDTVWVGADGFDDVSSTTGYPLNSGEQIWTGATNLNQLWFDADVSGEDICWLKA